MESSSTCIPPQPLKLYSNWKFCSSCALPAKEKKLSTCGGCKMTAYHNTACQRAHWKSGHKRDCKRLREAVGPLNDLVSVWDRFQTSCSKAKDVNKNFRSRLWWDLTWRDPFGGMKLFDDWHECERVWNEQEDFLTAAEGFNLALTPLMVQWMVRIGNADPNLQKNRHSIKELMPRFKDSEYDPEHDEDEDEGDNPIIYVNNGIANARMLLFSAYCESDSDQAKVSRIHLVQCISILLECSYICLHSPYEIDTELRLKVGNYTPGHPQPPAQETVKDFISSILNDAWIELMQSYEYDDRNPDKRSLSRHVAHLAIQSSFGNKLYDCIWKHPLQRPGYVAPLMSIPGSDTKTIVDPPFLPREDHPAWCRRLEENWEKIADELTFLTGNKSPPMVRKRWADVGCGDRGSGGDDHMVVSAKGKWKEYVLFGTGAFENDTDAPVTKKLLREFVPDAISLAKGGGGEVIFSKLAPKTRIDAHCGPTNLRWTAHLGLVIPKQKASDPATTRTETSTTETSKLSCGIKVADVWHEWEAGEVLVFDDSYEHEIRNDTDETRIVLLLRFWHTGLGLSDRQKELQAARNQKYIATEKRFKTPMSGC